MVLVHALVDAVLQTNIVIHMEHVHIQDLNVPTKKRDTKMKLLLQTKWVEVRIIAVLDGVGLT